MARGGGGVDFAVVYSRMTRRLRLALALMVAGTACSGSKSREQAAAQSTRTVTDSEPEPELEGYGVPVERKDGHRAWVIPKGTVAPVQQQAAPSADVLDVEGHKQEHARQRFKSDTPLYVDGTLVATVRYWELPPWLPSVWKTLGDGRRAERFLFAQYLESLGIDVAKITAVHLHGGRGRVAITSGDELRKVAGELLFSFTQGESGKMRMHWGPQFKVSDTIDKVQKVNIYIKTKAPKWDMRQMSLVDDAGNPLRDETDEMRGSVRVYVDGRIALLLKRKDLDAQGAIPSHIDGDVPMYDLFGYLRTKGVDGGRIAAMELYDRDELVARVEGADRLRNKKLPVEFAAPKQQGGRVVVHYPAGAGRDEMPVTAIGLFSTKRASAKHRR